MKFRLGVWTAPVLSTALFFTGGVVFASEGSSILESIAEVRGESSFAAANRIRREDDLARLDHSLQQLLGDSFGGSWLADSGDVLVVATTDPRNVRWINQVGAQARVVPHSRRGLERRAKSIEERIKAEVPGLKGFVSYLDGPANEWTVEVDAEDSGDKTGPLRRILNEYAKGPVRVVESDIDLSGFAERRGGDYFWNLDRGSYCSTGFNLEEGFTVASHCADRFDEITDNGLLGLVASSDFPNTDRAYVGSIAPGWSFLPEVNGYSSSNKDVNGLIAASVNSTVCRYGVKTGGPHCGTITARGVTATLTFGSTSATLSGLIRTNACAEPGDSGGPLITGTGQAQGMLVGGTTGQTCPNSPNSPVVTYYEPTAGAMVAMQTTLLTATGPTAPYVLHFRCPDYGNSGQGTFYCDLSYYTQGSTSVSWSTTNASGTGTDYAFFGSCAPGQPVTVDVDVSNPYGTETSQATFSCPSGPIP